MLTIIGVVRLVRRLILLKRSTWLARLTLQERPLLEMARLLRQFTLSRQYTWLEDHFTGTLPLLGYSHYWGSSLIAAAHVVETIHLTGAAHFMETTPLAGILPIIGVVRLLQRLILLKQFT